MADVDNPDGVPVILVNKYNKTQELKRKIVHTKNGRIPLRDICNEWCLKADTVVWHDDGVSEPVKINPKDGYSDMGFSFINEIVLMGEVLGVNQAHQASKHMNDSFKSTGSTSKSTPKKPLDVEVTVETQQAHPNVVRTNAFSNLVKTVKEKPATSTTTTPVVQQSTTTSATTSTYDKETQQHLDKLKSLYDNQILTEDEYNMKRKQIIDKAKEQQQQPKISTEQQDQITKLQSLLDKGILTQQEFDAKKKQVLGSSSSVPSVPSTTSTSSVPKPTTTTTTTSTPQTTGELVYDESKLTAQQKEQIAKIKAVREKGLLTKRDFEKKLREILEKK